MSSHALAAGHDHRCGRCHRLAPAPVGVRRRGLLRRAVRRQLGTGRGGGRWRCDRYRGRDRLGDHGAADPLPWEWARASGGLDLRRQGGDCARGACSERIRPGTCSSCLHEWSGARPWPDVRSRRERGYLMTRVSSADDCVSRSPRGLAVGVVAGIVDAATTIKQRDQRRRPRRSRTDIGANPSPGSVVKLRVVVNADTGDRWHSTRWTVGGAEMCENANRDGAHNNAAFVSPDNFTLPASGAVAARAQALHGRRAAPGTPVATKTGARHHPRRCCAQRPARRAVRPPHRDGARRVGLDLVDDRATKAVRDGAKAFVNSLPGRVRAGRDRVQHRRPARSRWAATSTTRSPTRTRAASSRPTSTATAPRRARATTRRSTRAPHFYTNWQDALLDTDAPRPLPELVIFITDGDPTARNTRAVRRRASRTAPTWRRTRRSWRPTR